MGKASGIVLADETFLHPTLTSSLLLFSHILDRLPLPCPSPFSMMKISLVAFPRPPCRGHVMTTPLIAAQATVLTAAGEAPAPDSAVVLAVAASEA